MAGTEKSETDNKGQLSPEERAALEKRASNLGQRLDEIKARRAPPTSGRPASGRSMADAFKIVADLVVGIGFGAAAGWYLDRYFGTAPWLMIVLLVLGFAAGLSNVIRTARKMQAEAEPLQRAAKSIEDSDDER